MLSFEKVETLGRLVTIPPLTRLHIQKCLEWAEDNMNVDSSKILFMDKSCATFHGPKGWNIGWVMNRQNCHLCLRCQQGGGGIWVSIIGGIIVSPWKVSDSIKMTADA